MQIFWQIVASNALLVVVLALGVTLLGRVWRNPQCLHLLWLLVLLKLVTPPVLTVPLPLPAERTIAALQEEPGPTSQRVTYAPAAEPQRCEAAPPAVGPIGPRPTDDRPISAAGAARDAAATATLSQKTRWLDVPWRAVLGWTWAVGIAFCASVHASRVFRFRRLLRSAEAPAAAVVGMAQRIAARLGLRRSPEIILLPVHVSPLVWSFGGRTRVLLPTALVERLDAPAQETILAHELAHVRRKDHWVRWLDVAIATVFWWHPVAWLASRRLQELEDQCADAMVVDLATHDARTYATALLDTLEFLSERPAAAPLGAAAAKSSAFLARRIRMLKHRTPQMRWTAGRLAMVLTVAAVPMTLAFAAAPPAAEGPKSGEPTSPKRPAVERRAVNKLVKDFPEKTDLSTPESAQAAWHRTSASMDAKALCELGVWKVEPRDIEEMERFWKRDAKDIAIYNEAQRNAEILEVLTYREDLAEVISKLAFPEGVGRDPFSSRCFGRINGAWKNLGEDRLPSLEAARESFDRKKDNLWKHYVKARDAVKAGTPMSLRPDRPKRSAPIAPGQPLGISVEKADLMGRVEWAMMHGGRDITARKSIEWGDVEKDKDGNRTIRYKFYATIWDKDVYVMNLVFTFDAKGNILDTKDVEGYPRKKVVKPADVSTQKGMKELVEDFFSKNFVDITSRKTMEWSEVTKDQEGNASIRYKYRARIWDRETKIMNQVFTFDAKGKFVSVKNVEGFPKEP